MRWRTAAKGAYLSNSRSSGLTGEDEGDGGAGIEVKVDHTLDGGESGGGEVLSVIDDDHRLAVQFGDGLEE